MILATKKNYYTRNLLGLILFFFANTGVATLQATAVEDPNKIKTNLTRIQNQIQKIEKKVYHNQRQEKALHQQLAVLEKEIGDQAEKIRFYESKRALHQKTLKALQPKALALQQKYQRQKEALKKLIQDTFQHAQQTPLSLFLISSESASARLNQYYRFFYEARARKISTLQHQLERIQSLQQHITQEEKTIQRLTDKVNLQQVALKEKKQDRTHILASLGKERSTAEEKLLSLQQQEAHLESLLKTLQDKLARTPTYIDPAQDFGKMKQRLLLPIALAESKLSELPHLKKPSKKSYIKAATGTPVNAIFPGRVVFSEWLRGIGLLLIVDHGHGYLSLYGNNQKLYKNVGDWVTAGEMIARVGQSGGHAEPGLYFEIRKDGEALDPSPWFAQG